MMQEFVKGVKDTARKATENMHTALPGVFISFDPSTGLAAVQPKAKFKKPNGEKIDFPQISGVPVVFPQSAGVAIAFPIKPNDGCLIVFAETALDYWQYGTETGTELRFDLTNAIAIPSLSPAANAAMQEACSGNAVVIKNGGTTLKVGSGGVTISGSLTVTGDVTAGGVSLKGHTHGTPEGSTTAPN